MRWVIKSIRLIHITVILLKHGLDKILWDNPSRHRFNSLIIFFPWRWFRDIKPVKGEDIRKAMEELGPLFVKFGQLLSTRRDLLPDDYANELSKLQDKVPPFSGKLAREMIEKSLQQPIEHFFEAFDENPLASASIAQVHTARLLDGTSVVIKVLRPHVHAHVRADIELLQTAAKVIHRFIPIARPLRLVEVVDEFKTILIDELDLLKEAANASLLRRNFKDSDSLYVPQVYWDLSRHNVLVLERIEGIPISDIQTLEAKHFDLKRLAEKGVEIFFTQVFRDSFFHADMHPGNIFVDPHSPTNPRYIAVDCGIMGTLGPEDQRYLGENFLAFFKRDYRKVAQLHVQSGWVPATTRVEAFESAIRTVCEPIFEKPLKDISIGQTLMRLFQTARRFDMQVQPQLVLLQKTLLSIEGLGRQIYPDLDLWQTAKPFLEKWMKKQSSPRALLQTLRRKLDIPEAIFDMVREWRPPVIVSAAEIQKKRKHKKRLKIAGCVFLCIGSAVMLPHLLLDSHLWIMGTCLAMGFYCLLSD